MTSDADAAAIKGAPCFRGGRIETLPNGVDGEYFAFDCRARDDSVVFVGNLAYPPNAEAIRWFVRDVFPLVVEGVPSARLRIVGMNPGTAITSLACGRRIEVTGCVADVRPYLWRASVSIAPMQSGGGIQNKVLEAGGVRPPAGPQLDAADTIYGMIPRWRGPSRR